MIKKLITLLCGLLILLFIGIILGLSMFLYYGKDLPPYKQLSRYDPPVVTRIHAGDGKLFAEFAKEKRVFIPIEAIPKHIVQTFLAVEDKNFYHHMGVDISSLLRAAGINLVNKTRGNKSLMGGSTITQQVAKNFLLSHERTLSRKIKEAILALRMEKTFSKEKILELYLNEIYLGAGSYGIGAAALNYFDKSLDELSIAEAAFIAALPKAPNHYHPKKSPQAAVQRRNWVIRRMYEEGIISEEEAKKAIEEPILLKNGQFKSIVHADYFAEEIRRFLIHTYGENDLYKGGLSVRSTLDSKLQHYADTALQNGLIEYDRSFGWHGRITSIPLDNWKENIQKIEKPKGAGDWHLGVTIKLDQDFAYIGLQDGTIGKIPFETMKWARQSKHLSNGHPSIGPELRKPSDALELGDVILVSKAHQETPEKTSLLKLEQLPIIEGALIAMDPYSGRILALSGGFSYERSQYNRATQAYRQPGSAFKPFVYLTAFENGYTPASTVLDAPFVLDQGIGNPLWSPQNIEKKFFGEVTLRRALEKSHNVATVRLANEIGMEKIVETAQRFGVYDDMPPLLSAVLGAQETTLLKLTTAFAILANGGKKISPIFIDRIQDRRGKTIFKNTTHTCVSCQSNQMSSLFTPVIRDERPQITDPISAYQIVSIFEGATESGTSRRAKVPNQKIAGKTGTSNDYNDTWFIGFSSNLVVGVFVGYDAPKSLGRFKTGATVAAPIFVDFMKKALHNKPSEPFRTPKSAKFVRINKETGLRAKPEDAMTFLEVFKPQEEPLTQEDFNSSKENPEEKTSLSLPKLETNGIY